MRKVGNIGFSAEVESESAATDLVNNVDHRIEQWLASKSKKAAGGADARELVLKDGRVATIVRSDDSLESGRLVHVGLTEPSSNGTIVFETQLRVATSGTAVGFSCELAVGVPGHGPGLHFDAHPPRVVREVVELHDNWDVSGTPVVDRPIYFSGADGGDELRAILWHPDRTVPVVVVSDNDGAVMADEIHDNLARELAGLALVGRADGPACWRLTNTKGKEWSVYNGAIRLYLPRVDQSGSPFHHPLWTAGGVATTAAKTSDGAVSRVRKQLRRRLLALSAFSTYVPPPITRVSEALSAQAFVASASEAKDDNDWAKLEKVYAKENDTLRARVHSQSAEISDLKVQLSNLQAALSWADDAASSEAPPPESEAPPVDVEEAVMRAADAFASELIFASGAFSGVDRLASDAGPPEKILKYLKVLADMTQARRRGPLGTDAVQWLRNQGITCSGESETIRNSDKETRLRTWDDGLDGTRYFDLHLKPSDGTSPDRCVRIYCDYDASHMKTIVGWIGRKPGL